MQISFDQVLVTAGLKQTRARQAILTIFSQENRPLDVPEILNLLKKQHVSVDQATVYRILEIFLQKRIIERFEFQEGKFRYELSGTEHHHLICEECGRIDDISDCSVSTLEKEIFERKGFTTKHHSLEFFGICQSCLP